MYFDCKMRLTEQYSVLLMRMGYYMDFCLVSGKIHPLVSILDETMVLV